MCGITGIIDFSGKPVAADDLAAAHANAFDQPIQSERISIAPAASMPTR